MRVTWLADVLRGAGLTVVEMQGWQGRGRELDRVSGVVVHGFGVHPLDPARGDRILRDGRPDLAGPLAQLGLDRDGRWRLIADGRCHHNGLGLWGNDTIGVEAYGRDTWTVIQLDSWQRGVAAILRHLRCGADRCMAHRETDPGRKPDPIGVDMRAFRAGVNRHLNPPEDDMTPEEHDWLARIHHEVAGGDTKPDTLVQTLERIEKRLAAIEAKVR